jgi:hypothetical protein
VCDERTLSVRVPRGRALAGVEKLMDKGEPRTTEEDAALDLMVRPIED